MFVCMELDMWKLDCNSLLTFRGCVVQQTEHQTQASQYLAGD